MSGKILHFRSISNLCHISPCQFCFGEIWHYFQLAWIVAILVVESHATPLGVRCQIKALPEYAPRIGLGHNSVGKNLKTSLIALANYQVSISESERESFVERCKVCSGCGMVWTLVISTGCSTLGFCAACGQCLLLLYLHNHRTNYQLMKKKEKIYLFFYFSCENVWIFLTFCFFCESLKIQT